MRESSAIVLAQEVWPEAEGFEAAPSGWTFRVGAGYAWLTNSGYVSPDPEGTRSRARQRLEAHTDTPHVVQGTDPVKARHLRAGE